MTGNLVKNGYTVKAFDINPQSLEKCSDIVRNKDPMTINVGSQTSQDYC